MKQTEAKPFQFIVRVDEETAGAIRDLIPTGYRQMLMEACLRAIAGRLLDENPMELVNAVICGKPLVVDVASE